MVDDFVQQRETKRFVVTVDGVRCALAAKWTEKSWKALSRKEQRFVFLAHTSFKFFVLHVFLPYVSQLEQEKRLTKLPDFMERFCDHFQNKVPDPLVPFDRKRAKDKRWRVCRVWPTGCAKSTLVAAAQSWLMAINPSVTQVAVFSIKELGERIVTLHKSTINENERYRHVFGDLNPEATVGERIWRADTFAVERPVRRATASFTIVGYRGSLEGIRCDVAWVDDLVDENNSLTSEARATQYLWVNTVLERRLHPERRLLYVIGTVHYGDDLYAHCEQHAVEEKNWDFEKLAMIPQSAIDAGLWPPQKINDTLPYAMDNVIVPEVPTLWPDFWTPEKVVDDFVASRHAFARTRQNVVQDPDSALFTEQELGYCLADGNLTLAGDPKPELVLWRYSDGIPVVGSPIYDLYEQAGIDIEYGVVTADFAATDPAPGKDPDYTVYQLWGWCRNTKRRVLLDTWRFRTSSPKVMKARLVMFVQNYLPIVRKIAGEANAVDKLFVRDLSDYVREHTGQPVRIVELKGEKAELIQSFKDLIEDNGVWIPYSSRSVRTRREVDVFKQELIHYPQQGYHDDTLIATVHNIRLLKSGSFSGGANVLVVGGSIQEDNELSDQYRNLPEADFGESETTHRDGWGHVGEVRRQARCQTMQRSRIAIAQFR